MSEQAIEREIWEQIEPDKAVVDESRQVIEEAVGRALAAWESSKEDLEVEIGGQFVPKKGGALALRQAIEDGEMVLGVLQGLTGPVSWVDVKNVSLRCRSAKAEGPVIYLSFPQNFSSLVPDPDSRLKKAEGALIVALKKDIDLGKNPRGRVKTSDRLIRIFVDI